jgi:hypothetical protein
MKSTDLRIGNKFECMGMVQTVFEICDNTDRGRIKQAGYEHIIRCEENGNQYKPIEISGIPLTEEWLLKFRLQKLTAENGLHYSNIDIFRIYWPKKDRCASIHIKPDVTEWYPCVIENIEFVHTFQNVIYALTGTELLLNP